MDEKSIKSTKTTDVSTETKRSGVSSMQKSPEKKVPPPPPPNRSAAESRPPAPPNPPRKTPPKPPQKQDLTSQAEKNKKAESAETKTAIGKKNATEANVEKTSQTNIEKTAKSDAKKTIESEKTTKSDAKQPIISPSSEEQSVIKSQSMSQKDGEFTLEEEIEIAKLQCEDDDNAAAIINQDEVIEKSYKAGLSDQDKQRQKRRLRRLLLLLLLLLLFVGTASATYFIIKNKTEFVPEFYDNVAIDVDFSFERSENRMPGDSLILMRPVEVFVRADTEEINYDVVALGVRVTAKYTETGEDCSSIIDIGFCDSSQVYKNTDVELFGGFFRCGKDIMFYYNKVLEPGQSEKLINAIRISPLTTNENAKKEITVKIEVLAVYPNPAQIKADNSEFINAPQAWVEDVYDKMTNIFKERAKRK